MRPSFVLQERQTISQNMAHQTRPLVDVVANAGSLQRHVVESKKSRMKHMDKHFWMEKALHERYLRARQIFHHAYAVPVMGGHYAQFYRIPCNELLS